MKNKIRHLAAVFCCGLCGFSAAALENPGFETLNSTGDFPVGWGKHWLNTGDFNIVTSPEEACTGSVALKISHAGEGAPSPFATVGSSRIKLSDKRAFTVSVRARGKGRLGINTYLYGSMNYLVPLTAEEEFFQWFTVDSDQYQEFTASFTVPEKGKIPADGNIFVVDEFEVLFNIQGGTVYLDDVELYFQGEKVIRPNAFFDASRPSLITLPRLAEAPKLDGELDDAVWSQAAATTGFRTLDDKIAPQQCTFYAGYDDRNLYFAFHSPQHALMLAQGPTGREITLGPNMEAVEIWLQPPNSPAMQFIGVPSGGLNTASTETQRANWGKNVQYASKVLESSEMAGGILTLGDKLWTGEIVIPFADLGVKPPQDGDVWRINFCRDFSVPEGSARAQSDWTTWAQVGNSFANVDKFGYARFSNSGKPFRLSGFGVPQEGALRLTGSAPAGTQLAGQILLRNQEKQVVSRIEQLTQDGEFELAETIRTTARGVTPMELLFSARDEAGNEIAQGQLSFSLMPTFWISSKLFYGRQVIDVSVDASRSELPPGCVAEIGLYAPGGNTALASASQEISQENAKFVLPLKFDQIPPGDYLLRGVVRDSAGNEIASTVESQNIPAKPHWLGNQIGISDKVPPPFTPVTVDGNRVGVVLREYLLGDNGLPKQITARGMELLAAPANFAAVVNGKPVEWNFKPLAMTSHNDVGAEFDFAAESEFLDLKGTLRIEYDGFAIWNATLTPKTRVTLNSLQFQIPMKEEFAYFGRGDGFTVGSILQDRYTTVPGREDLITLGNTVTEWGSWQYCRTGWAWPETFFNEVYLGSDQAGFSLMTEGARNIHGPKYATMTPEKEQHSVELAVNLVSEPITLESPLEYSYFYQTMPLRPEPKDPKVWHINYDPGSAYNGTLPGYSTPEAKEYLANTYAGHAYYDLTPDGYPRVADPERVKKAIDDFHKLGLNKLVHNLWYGAIADSLPEYQIFGAEWDALPKFGWSTPNSHLTSACLASSFQDFHIWCTKGIVDDIGYDGVYTDATPIQCSNALHGCGYAGPDGERKTTLNILATRNFVKRMYNVLKADGRDRINFSHSGEGGATGAFNDMRTHGEEICWEGKDHYRRVTPDYFRAKYAQTEYGVPYTLYPVFYHKWRAVGEQVPLSEIMMMCLAHRISAAVAHLETPMLPLWRLFDPWWTTSDFIAYWKPEAPVQTDDPVNVTASTFLKKAENRALVVLSNWKYEPSTITVQADPARLGFTPKSVQLIDVLAEKSSELQPDEMSVQLPARDFRVLLLEGGENNE